MAQNTEYKLAIGGYTTDIVLIKHNGFIYCTKSGDLKTMDRNGQNVQTIYNFALNGYPGHNVHRAIVLPSGKMMVALTAYDNTLKFLRSNDTSYTTWTLVHSDWNGQMLYAGWSVSPSGVLMCAEYPTHNNILSVRLWKVTNDGQTWEVVHTFNGRQGTLTELKQIFHIHTVEYDPYTGDFWVGTGDTDAECQVYKYNGTTMTLVGEGSQLWRTVSFIFAPNYVIWGSDGGILVNGSLKCFMVRVDRDTLQMEQLKAVDSTIFNNEYIESNRVYLSCGTPNEINLSNDGRNWYKALNLRLNPDLPSAYSWFYDYVDNGDGRIFGYITGIMREDTNTPLSHGTIILDLAK